MIVDNPMSCIVNDVGAPALALLPCSSCVKDLHSGPDSWDFSEITYPHFPQNLSPVTSSVNSEFFAQRGQLSALRDCNTITGSLSGHIIITSMKSGNI